MSSINSMHATTASLNQQVAVKIAAQSLNALKAQGQAVVSLLQASVELQQQLQSQTAGPSTNRVDVVA